MSTQRSTGSNVGTFLALLGMLVISVALLALAAMVVPQILGILIVVFGFGLLCSFHYIVWGWWMAGLPNEDDDEITER